eukprot:CAMPEP_0170502282 /NCGR_PEP_ID=MMETSP0208-20121228/41050_1 /TAXON_ID=197538 /ORGANISM="Strombidium inclinatum, Strain S3" /LENGTH=67 /DNA_ID=CAMNT_0010781281 /DNA_START=410 /DNA_END=610 /DNA_ORIENTATION=+
MQLSPTTSKIFLTSEDPRMMNVRLSAVQSKGQDYQPATASPMKKEEIGYDSGTFSGQGIVRERSRKQ